MVITQSELKSKLPVWERQQRRINKCRHLLNTKVRCIECPDYNECMACVYPNCEQCEYASHCYYLANLHRNLDDPMNYCVDPYFDGPCYRCKHYLYCPALNKIETIGSEARRPLIERFNNIRGGLKP